MSNQVVPVLEGKGYRRHRFVAGLDLVERDFPTGRHVHYGSVVLVPDREGYFVWKGNLVKSSPRFECLGHLVDKDLQEDAVAGCLEALGAPDNSSVVPKRDVGSETILFDVYHL